MTAPIRYLGQDSPRPFTTGELARRLLWSLVERSLFRWSPRFAHRWRVALLQGFGAQVDRPSTVRVFPTASVHFPWKLRLGAHCLVGPGVRLYNLGEITIGPGANLSRHIHLCSGSHNFNRWDMPLTTAPITIGPNVWIATDTFIGPGVEIGELSVVGARSVVVDDLPPRMICVGHPCLPVRPREEPS